jgi:hypothetical protein
MAQISDNLGRVVAAQNTANMTLEQIRDMLGTKLKSPVGEAKSFGKEKSADPALQKISDMFTQYVKDFKADVDDRKTYIDDMKKVLEEIRDKKEQTGKEKKDSTAEAADLSFMEQFAKMAMSATSIYTKDEDARKSLTEISTTLKTMQQSSSTKVESAVSSMVEIKGMDNLEKMALRGMKPGSIYTNDAGVRKVLRKISSTLNKVAEKMGVVSDVEKSIKPPKDPKPPKPPKPPGGKNPSEHLDDIVGKPPVEPKEKKTEKKRDQKFDPYAAKRWADKTEEIISQGLMGIKLTDYISFESLLVQERKLVQETRKIAYEINGATKGSKALTESFDAMGKTSAMTGKTRDEFQKLYVDNLKKGIREAKTAQKITVAQLNTEEQLGMEAQALGDTFSDMNLKLKMNSSQVAEVGRGMREVARNTGMTGKELAGVITSSATFVNNMRKAGTLTTASYKNIVELQANLKKVGEEGGGMMDALSSTNKLLAADSKMFNLLAISASRAGLTTELLNGSITKSKDSLKGMAGGFKSIANQFGIAGETAEEMRKNLEELDDATKRNINISLESALGVEAGQLISQFEAISNSSKTLADKLSDLNAKKKTNITLDEKAGIAEEERKLRLGKSLEVLTALDKAASSATNMGDALQSFSKKRSEFEGDLNALGVAWTSETDVARKAIEGSLQGVNKQLKDAGKKELKIDASQIEKALKDPAAIRELTAQITKAEQEASTASKAQLDPASASAQSLKEINDSIRNLVGGGLSAVFSSAFGGMLATLGLVVSFGAMAVSWLSGIYSYLRSGDQLNNFIQAYEMSGQRKLEETTSKSTQNLNKEATTEGSIYTHDSHSEKILNEILAALRAGKSQAGAGAGTGGGGGFNVTKFDPLKSEHHDLGMSAAKKKDGQLRAAGKSGMSDEAMKKMAAGIAAKKESAIQGGAVGFRDQKKLAAKTGGGEKFNKALERAEENHTKRRIKFQRQEMAHDMRRIKGEKKCDPCPDTKDVDVESPKGSSFIEETMSMLKSIKPQEMLQLGAIIAAMAVGLLILGAAIMFIGTKIIKALNLDLATVAETAAVIVAIGGAAVGIAMASMELIDMLQENKKAIKKISDPKKAKELAKVAGSLALISIATVALGAMIVKVSDMILKGLGLSPASVMETAMVIAELGAATTGIVLASVGTAMVLDNIKKYKMISNPMGTVKTIMNVGKSLLMITGAIILLGAAIMKMSEMILGGLNLNPSAIAATTATIVALGVGVGIIATAVLTAMAGLKLIGGMRQTIEQNMDTMIDGAIILLLFTPAIILLGAAIMKMGEMILGVFDLNAAKAVEISTAVVAVLLGAAIIAGAVGAAMFGLATIGGMWSIISAAITPMTIGAEVLMVATPVILLLGAAIMKMGEMILGAFSLDAAKATEISTAVVAVLMGAAIIAGAVGAAMYGLSALGGMWPIIYAALTPMAIGAGILLVATPVIITLGAAIVAMGDKILGAFDLTAAKATEISTAVVTVLISAAMIAGAVGGAMFGLSALGGMWEIIKRALKPMAKGAMILLVATPIILLLGAAIVAMGDKILGAFDLTAAKAAEISAAVVAVLVAAATIAGAVGAAMFGLSALGGMWSIITGAIPMMALGALVLLVATPAIILLGGAIVKMGEKILGGFGLDAGKAKEIGEAVASIISSAGSIAMTVAKAMVGLALLGTQAAFIWGYVPLMWIGAKTLMMLIPPVLFLGAAIVKMGEFILGVLKLDANKAKEISEAITAVMSAAASITGSVIKSSVMLSIMGALLPVAREIALMALLGVLAFSILSVPLILYVAAVLGFVKAVSAIMNPKTAAEMSQGVTDVMTACRTVTIEIVKSAALLGALGLLSVLGVGAILYAGLMYLGIAALFILSKPIYDYVRTIRDFSKKVGSIINPKLATEMGKGVTDVMTACRDVTLEIVKAVPLLMVLGSWGGLGVLALLYAGLMYLGVMTLNILSVPIEHYISSIVAFSKSVGSSLNPKLAASMGQGVAEVMRAVAAVTIEIVKAVPLLMVLGSWGGLGALALLYAGLMYIGVMTLNILSAPIGYYIRSVVAFSKSVGSSLNPKQAAEMGQGVAEVMRAVAAVTAEIVKAVPLLMGLASFGGLGAMALLYAGLMYLGVMTLNILSAPIKEYIDSVVSFSKSVGGKLNPRMAASMASGVAEVMRACSLVAVEIVKSAHMLTALSVLYMFSGIMSSLMGYGTEALKVMTPPIMTFLDEIVSMSKNLQKKVSIKEAAKLAYLMKMIGDLVRSVASVVNDLYKNILPLMKVGWISDSIVVQLEKAMPMFQAFFAKVADFVKVGIVDAVRSQFSNMKDLRDAAKKIDAMAQILRLVAPVMKIMSENIAPMTQPGFFSASPVDKISKGMVKMDGFFRSVAEFVSDGIIKPVMEKMSDSKELKEVARRLAALSVILQSTATMIEATAKVIGFMDPTSFFSDAPMEKIMKNKGKFRTWFNSIVVLIKDGIIAPVALIGDSKVLKDTAMKLCQMSSIMKSVVSVIESVAKAIGMMDPKYIFFDSPVDKIMKNKDKFKESFIAISKFINDGIVKPVVSEFGDAREITVASVILKAMAKAIWAVPRVITGLAAAISLMTDSKSFFKDTPVDSIMKNKDQFGIYFKSIAKFLKEGIVDPILDEMGDAKDIQTAAKILKAMNKVITYIPKVILGVSEGLMPLMLGGKRLEKDTPFETILDNKDQFATYFRTIAKFLKEGIVNPILEELGDGKDIQSAAKTLRSMSKVINYIPKVIRGVSEGLMPLMMSKDLTKDSPMEKIMENKAEFETYFRSIAKFLKEGIVNPILDEMGDGKEIQSAGKTLRAMSSIVRIIPLLISRLSKAFGLMKPEDCIKDSPIAALSKHASEFAGWFYEVATFMRHGIVEPLLEGAVSPEEIVSASEAIDNIAVNIENVPGFVSRLSTAISGLMNSEYFDYKIFKNAKLVGDWFGGIARSLLDGFIYPIREMPDSTEMEELKNRLYVISDIIPAVQEVIGQLVANIAPLVTNNSWFSALPISMLEKQTRVFGDYWMGISEFINLGIVQPIIMNLPESRVLSEANDRIVGVSKILAVVNEVVGYLMSTITPLVSSKGWFSDLPIVQLEKQTKVFAEYWKQISRFLNEGIINPIMKNLPNSAVLQEANDRISMTVRIIGNVVNVIKKFSSSISPMMKGGFINNSEIANVQKATKDFGTYWNNITVFLNNGLINPILNNLPDSSELKEVLSRTELLSDVIESVRTSMLTFMEVLAPMMEGGISSPISEIQKSTEEFGGSFKAIATFLRDGLINPILENIPNSTELQEALLRIELVTEMIVAIKTAMSTLSDSISSVSGMDLGSMNIGDIALLSGMSNSVKPKIGGGGVSGGGSMGSGVSGGDAVKPEKSSSKDLSGALSKSKPAGVSGDAVKPEKSSSKDLSGALSESKPAAGATSLIGDGLSLIGSAIGGVASGAASIVTGGLSLIGSAIGGVASLAKNIVGGGLSLVGSAIGGVASLAKNIVGGGLSLVGSAIGGVASLAKNIVGGGLSLVGSAIGGVASLAKNIVGGGLSLVGSAISGVASGAASIVTGGISAVGSAISGVASGAASIVTGGISSIWGGIKSVGSAIGNVASGAASLVTGGISAVGSAISGTASLAKNIVGGGLSLVGSAISGTASLAKNIVGGGLSLVGSAISGTASLAKNIVGGGISLVGSAIGGVASGAASLVTGGISSIWGGIKSVGSAIGSVASGAASLVTGGISAVGSAIGGVASGAASLVTGGISAVGSAIGGVASGAKSIVGDSLSSVGSAIGGAGSALWSGVEKMGSSVCCADQVAAVPPMKESMREKVGKDVVTSEPSNTNVSSPELSEMKDETCEQTKMQEEMVKLLTSLLKVFTQPAKSGEGGAAQLDTSVRKTGSKPAKDAKWPYGSHSATAGKQITNMGSSSPR